MIKPKFKKSIRKLNIILSIQIFWPDRTSDTPHHTCDLHLAIFLKIYTISHMTNVIFYGDSYLGQDTLR